jgi:hypothetical protein
LESWSSGTWVQFAATSDIGGAGVLFTTTGMLDVIDFPDVTTTQIRLTINHTQVTNDQANVVALEAYRKLDITSRVKSVKVSRQRDYKLANPMASSVQLDVINTDRFFSISHIPSATEVTAGFVNQELQPGVGIIVSLGFNYFGSAPEYVTTFTGEIDSISIRPSSRDVVISGRDLIKRLINKIDSTKLKSGLDIGYLIQYVLNRANLSTYEMAVDQTGVNIDYFFTDQQSILDTIRDLSQASGDALFYVSELGIPQFKDYSIAGGVGIGNQKLWTSQIDWQAGTLSNIDTISVPGDIIPDFASFSSTQSTSWWSSFSGWNIINAIGGSWFLFSGQISFSGQTGLHGHGWVYRANTSNQGSWSISQNAFNIANSSTLVNSFYFMANQAPSGGGQFYQGYAIKTSWNSAGVVTVSLIRQDSSTIGAETSLGSFSYTPGSGFNIQVTRDTRGFFQVWVAGVLRFTATDTTYYTSAFLGFYSEVACTVLQSGPWVYALNIPSTSLVGTWTSPILDTGTNTTAFGALTATQVLNNGSTSFNTRSSPNGYSWSAWQPLTVSGFIQSPVGRYLQIQAVLDTNGQTGCPDILDITVNWTVGGAGGTLGTHKYPAAPSSFTFAFNSSLLDVQQGLADNLGGDTSILNDIIVQAQPFVMAGNTTDTVWQGTVGTPPSNISAGLPLSVTAGQKITIAPYISGGMDVSLMSGANPAAAAVTFAGGASGNWSFSSIHPTLPVLVINITGTGTITDLRIIGRTFQNASYIQTQEVQSAQSIALYGDRQLSVSNPWIVSAAIASSIANTLIANYKSPTAYVPLARVALCPSVQIGDRVTVNDTNLDLTADYIVVGEDHVFSTSNDNAQVETDLVLLKVPTGL